MVAKPACAIERMEACQRQRLAVADIMKPGGVSERGPPRWLDKVGYDVDPGGYGSGVIEPGPRSRRAATAPASDCSGTAVRRSRLVTSASTLIRSHLDPTVAMPQILGLPAVRSWDIAGEQHACPEQRRIRFPAKVHRTQKLRQQSAEGYEREAA
jgi:hypothetical protein